MNSTGASTLQLRCDSCGYDITSLVEHRGKHNPGVCPECGTEIRNALAKRIDWLPRCMRCGYNLTPLIHHLETDPSLCPDCSSPTDEAIQQCQLLPVCKTLTPRAWARSIWIAVRHPQRFLLSVDVRSPRVYIVSCLNTLMIILLLGVPATALYEQTVDRARYHPRVYIGEMRAPLEMIMFIVACAIFAAFIGGGWFTILAVRKVGDPTQRHVLLAGLFFASCICLFYSVILSPFVAAVGLFPPPWTNYPDWLGAIWMIGEASLIPLAILTTCYGVWILRFLNPGRRPAA